MVSLGQASHELWRGVGLKDLVSAAWNPFEKDNLGRGRNLSSSEIGIKFHHWRQIKLSTHPLIYFLQFSNIIAKGNIWLLAQLLFYLLYLILCFVLQVQAWFVIYTHMYILSKFLFLKNIF
jgi:hypothetical protein